MIGRTLVIKGELSSGEPLYIEGSVEGAIHAAGQRLTVGREGKVNADIVAKELVIMGKVKGTIEAAERVDVRHEGSLSGDVVTGRISVEDGAMLRGNIEICRAIQHKEEKPPEQKNGVPDLPTAGQPGIAQSRAAAAAASPATAATRVRGSKVLYQQEPKP